MDFLVVTIDEVESTQSYLIDFLKAHLLGYFKYSHKLKELKINFPLFYFLAYIFP